MRFNLIDQVVEQQGDSLVAIKCVSSAEEYLADHFPGFPVLPGVMMLETMVQSGRLLVKAQESGSSSASLRHDNDDRTTQPLVLADVRNVRYSNMVRPGQSLRVQVTIRKHDAEGWELDGVGSVQDDVVVQGRFRLAPLKLVSAMNQGR